jgi:hypothetical protein
MEVLHMTPADLAAWDRLRDESVDYDRERLDKVARLYNDGASYAEIMRRTGLKQGPLSNTLARLWQLGTCVRRKPNYLMQKE